METRVESRHGLVCQKHPAQSLTQAGLFCNKRHVQGDSSTRAEFLTGMQQPVSNQIVLNHTLRGMPLLVQAQHAEPRFTGLLIHSALMLLYMRKTNFEAPIKPNEPQNRARPMQKFSDVPK